VADLHERLGNRILGEAAGAELDELAGYHLEQATGYTIELGPSDAKTRELGRRAATLLGRAGRRAYERGDARAASNLLFRAAALLPENEPQRLELWQEGAENLLSGGEFERARAVFDDLVERASAAGDASRLALARLFRVFASAFTDPAFELDDLFKATIAAQPVFEATGDEGGLARVHDARAFVHDLRGEYSKLEQEAELALEHHAEPATRALRTRCSGNRR
jgi:hypothetical protein